MEVPENQVVNPGNDVIFRCRTSSRESVDWQFQRQGKAEVNVFIGRTGGGGDMSNGYVQKKRVHVKMVIPEGQYDLVIRNVTAPDEGTYSCSDISDPSIAGSASLVIVGKGWLIKRINLYRIRITITLGGSIETFYLCSLPWTRST